MGTVYCCDCAKENADLKDELRKANEAMVAYKNKAEKAEVRLEHRERILGGYVEEKQAEIERLQLKVSALTSQAIEEEE